MPADIRYRNANRKDLRAIGHIFLAAFPESVEHYVGHPVGPSVIEDAFAIVLDAEPEAFFVAAVDGKVAGYIVAPTRFSRIVRTAILHGHVLRMSWHWISGRYRVGIKPVWIAVRNWLGLVSEARQGELHAEARILSIAVDPTCQGMGIGTGLMKLGMDYLRSRGEKLVRLEVRPDNRAAIHIYEKYGFEARGVTRDTQGEWLVMILDLSGGGS
jgi:ribosomal-protein-alanine N-acetyltransferase